MITMSKMKCSNCEYDWENRKEKPKECPRCKHRLDYPRSKNLKTSKPLKLNKEVREIGRASCRERV